MFFNREFDARHGEAVPVATGVRRVTALNANAFTFRGTNSYIVGEGDVAIIDPGPDDPAHLEALLRATEGERVRHILLTHTHRDHSAGTAMLKAATGATVLAEGPHRPSRPPVEGVAATLDAAGDRDFVPDRLIRDGETLAGDGWSLTAIGTPGHTANHLAFALDGSGALFSGDHVMAWSTTIVAPPDGAMADYMASLDKLAARSEELYFPGHGGPVSDAPAFVRGIRAHRRMREAAILERLARGDRTVPEIVAIIYRETPAELRGAAGLAVLAHIEDLVERGRVRAPDGITITGVYERI